MLTTSGESRRPCPVSSPKGEIFSLVSLSMVIAVGVFFKLSFRRMKEFNSIPSLPRVVLNHEWMLNFVKCFFWY